MHGLLEPGGQPERHEHVEGQVERRPDVLAAEEHGDEGQGRRGQPSEPQLRMFPERGNGEVQQRARPDGKCAHSAAPGDSVVTLILEELGHQSAVGPAELVGIEVQERGVDPDGCLDDIVRCHHTSSGSDAGMRGSTSFCRVIRTALARRLASEVSTRAPK